jgi:hypothetical protein
MTEFGRKFALRDRPTKGLNDAKRMSRVVQESIASNALGADGDADHCCGSLVCSLLGLTSEAFQSRASAVSAERRSRIDTRPWLLPRSRDRGSRSRPCQQSRGKTPARPQRGRQLSPFRQRQALRAQRQARARRRRDRRSLRRRLVEQSPGGLWSICKTKAAWTAFLFGPLRTKFSRPRW